MLKWCYWLSIFLLLCLSQQAWAKGVVAGTIVKLDTIITYTPAYSQKELMTGGATAKFTVDEVIDMDVVTLDPNGVAVKSPSTGNVLTFKLTNVGNDTEAFHLTAKDNITGDDFNPQTSVIWVERNEQAGLQSDDERYSEVNPVSLEIDESILIYVVSDIAKDQQGKTIGKVELIASSATPGATSILRGDAVPEANGKPYRSVPLVDFARKSTDSFFKVNSVQVLVNKSLKSSQDPYGGSEIISGATLTYLIKVDVAGDGIAEKVNLSDITPIHTDYIAGSALLNGEKLTDAEDEDAFDYGIHLEGGWQMNLGDLVAPTSHIIEVSYIVN